jgi:hypothetical protein
MSSPPISWKHSFVIAALACYAPFLVCLIPIESRLPSVDFAGRSSSAMSAKEFFHIHLLCMVGPSLPVLFLLSHVVPGASSTVSAMAAIATVGGVITGVAALGRLGQKPLLAGAIAAFVIYAISAIVLYAMSTGS